MKWNNEIGDCNKISSCKTKSFMTVGGINSPAFGNANDKEHYRQSSKSQSGLVTLHFLMIHNHFSTFTPS